MTSSPKICSSCGVNFMKIRHWDESEKKCNSCSHKDKKKLGDRKTRMKICIDFSEEEHNEIETFCFEHGKTFSEYFLSLHRENTQKNNSKIAEKAKSTRQNNKGKHD